MTKFEHEWLAPATELPEPRRPRAYQELADCRVENIRLRQERDNAQTRKRILHDMNRDLIDENRDLIDENTKLRSQLAALVQDEKPAESAPKGAEIELSDFEWYRTPSMLKEFPAPHVVHKPKGAEA